MQWNLTLQSHHYNYSYFFLAGRKGSLKDLCHRFVSFAVKCHSHQIRLIIIIVIVIIIVTTFLMGKGVHYSVALHVSLQANGVWYVILC